jgi:hypothetical protein
MRERKYGFWKGFIPVIAAGAVAFGLMNGCESGLEKKVKPLEIPKQAQRQETEDKSQDKQRLKELDEKYGFLDSDREAVSRNLAYYSQRLGINDVATEDVLAQAFVEGRTVKKDPMQIANQGDYGLDVLANGLENSYLVGDFSCLKGKTHTPRGFKTVKVRVGKGKDARIVERKVGFWDESQSNMTREESFYGGIGFLLHKRADYATRTVESGDIGEYVIQKGDSFAGIAGKLGTTTAVLLKYNPDAKPDRLKIGQKVKYRQARTEAYIAGWKNLDEAVRLYNGGGDAEYFNKVSRAKQELMARNKLRAVFSYSSR